MNNLSPFSSMIEEFIALKKTEGYKYVDGADYLRRFDSFLAGQTLESMSLNKDIMDEWCRQSIYESRKTLSNRVATIRQFTIYLTTLGYQAHVPDTIKKAKNMLFIPYIFSHSEIIHLFHTIDTLPPGRQENSDIVYPVLFRMLYGCGLRISEALALKIGDIDLDKGIITIKHAKYDKKRLVPMSEQLTLICRDYANRHLAAFTQNDYFFRKKYGGTRKRSTVGQQFRTILLKSGIPYHGKGKGPRLHDVRHTFCCHSLKHLSDKGIDLYCALPVLSTYVGHSTISATERYVRLTLEIYPDIAEKINHATGHIYPEVFYNVKSD